MHYRLAVVRLLLVCQDMQANDSQYPCGRPIAGHPSPLFGCSECHTCLYQELPCSAQAAHCTNPRRLKELWATFPARPYPGHEQKDFTVLY